MNGDVETISAPFGGSVGLAELARPMKTHELTPTNTSSAASSDIFNFDLPSSPGIMGGFGVNISEWDGTRLSPTELKNCTSFKPIEQDSSGGSKLLDLGQCNGSARRGAASPSAMSVRGETTLLPNNSPAACAVVSTSQSYMNAYPAPTPQARHHGMSHTPFQASNGLSYQANDSNNTAFLSPNGNLTRTCSNNVAKSYDDSVFSFPSAPGFSQHLLGNSDSSFQVYNNYPANQDPKRYTSGTNTFQNCLLSPPIVQSGSDTQTTNSIVQRNSFAPPVQGATHSMMTSYSLCTTYSTKPICNPAVVARANAPVPLSPGRAKGKSPMSPTYNSQGFMPAFGQQSAAPRANSNMFTQPYQYPNNVFPQNANYDLKVNLTNPLWTQSHVAKTSAGSSAKYGGASTGQYGTTNMAPLAQLSPTAPQCMRQASNNAMASPSYPGATTDPLMLFPTPPDAAANIKVETEATGYGNYQYSPGSSSGAGGADVGAHNTGWTHAVQSTTERWSLHSQVKRARIMATGGSKQGLVGAMSTGDESVVPGLVDMEEDIDGEFGDEGKPSRTGAHRLNHSEIEKRRRDKMNTYITELAKLVPMCHDMNRKMDKLTVLRMAVQHIKSLRGESNTRTEVSHLPSFITDGHVKDLILEVAGGFTFAISCDRGKILYASESIKSVLNYKQPELIGQNLFDFVHHKDISKVKDQLATNDFTPKERYIDAKTMKLIKTRLPRAHLRLRSGGRRMFVCRMKKSQLYTGGAADGVGIAGGGGGGGTTTQLGGGGVSRDEAEADFHVPGRVPGGGGGKQDAPMGVKMRGGAGGKRKMDKRNYVTVLCMGYIKPWVTSKATTSHAMTSDDDDHDADNEGVNLNSLIAVGIPLDNLSPSSETEVPTLSESELRNATPEFMSRHNIDGKFIHVDHRVTSVLGYVPQELTGTSIYEYCHKDSVQSFAELHKQVLKTKEKLGMRTHRFRSKDGRYVSLGTSALVFCNPWTKEREQVVCTHKLVQECSVTSSSEEETDHTMYSSDQKAYSKSPVTIPSKDFSVIGRRIVDEINRESSPSTKFFDVDSSTARSSNSGGGPGHHRSMSALGHRGSGGGSSGMGPSPSKRICSGLHITSTTSGSSSQRDSSSGADTTDEAAMAMVMNLLEAEGGLGGPIDFNDLPWPL